MLPYQFLIRINHFLKFQSRIHYRCQSSCVVVVVVFVVVGAVAAVVEAAVCRSSRRMVSYPEASQKVFKVNFAYQEHLQTLPSCGAQGHSVKPPKRNSARG